MKIISITATLFLLCILQTSAVGQAWSLEKCLQYAEKHNKDLLAGQEAVQAALNIQKASRSNLLPEINGHAEMDYYWQIPVQAFPAELVGGEPGTFVPVRISTPWTASFGADASLKLIDPQTWQTMKLSSLQVQMAEGELRSLLQQLLKNVRMAYHSVQSEQDRLQAMLQLYESYTEIHRLIELQYQKGISDQITFNQSLSLLNDREEASTQAAIALRAAYLDLKFWMGYPLNDSLSIQYDTEIPEPHLYEFDAAQLPDYEVRRLQQIQAEQQWKQSRSHMLPSLSGVAGFQRVAFRNAFDFVEGGEWYNVGSIGLKLNIPIFSLRQVVYEPAQQKALWKQASHQFDRYQVEQERAFQMEMMQLEQAYEVWQNQQENLRLAKQNETLSISKIEKGIIDMMQLRQIQDDLYQMQQKLSKARLDYLRHYVALKYMQGNE